MSELIYQYEEQDENKASELWVICAGPTFAGSRVLVVLIAEIEL